MWSEDHEDEARAKAAEAPERIQAPMRTDDIPRLFTTETFCKMVVRAQHAVATADG